MVQTEQLKKTISKLWENSLKEYDKMTKEGSKLLKKGEKNLRTASHTSKQRLEVVNLTVKREKLYYQLGKTTSKQPKSRWQKSTKIESLLKQIKKLDREIKKLSTQKKSTSRKK